MTESQGLQLVATNEGFKKFAIQLSNCTEITSLIMRYYTWSGVDKIDLTNCINLEKIAMNHLGGVEVDIKGLPKLNYLELMNMKNYTEYYKMPDVTGCIALNRINFNGNFMTNSDLNNMIEQLGKNHNIQYLDLSRNSISDISLIDTLKNLKYLNLNTNNLSTLNGIQNLSNLVEICLKYNNLSTANLVDLVNLNGTYRKLSRVYLYGNNITDYSSVEAFADPQYVQAP